ncbi:MAG: amidohydrolase family protein, partial [Acidobacteriaceae bacterium]|nr:amidohydrolase family protein [Acidobacteriaceae bacterium]
MRVYILHLCAVITLASGVLAAQEAKRVVLRCGSLLDPQSDTVMKDVLIVTEGGVVKEVGSGAGDVSASAIDLSHGFCLPGLIDVHDHLTSDPTHAGYSSLGLSVPRTAITGAKNARITLQAGFTTVRNVGAEGYSDVALRDGINAGEIPGPRL